jgi:hypothetical protein
VAGPARRPRPPREARLAAVMNEREPVEALFALLARP